MNHDYDVIIAGAGFTGLTAAFILSRAGHKVRVVESDAVPGGLAGTFEFSDGVRLEKFYHHWFNNDIYVPELVSQLGMDNEILKFPSRTAMFFNGRQWRLSTPLDLLRFTALSLKDRIRLGLLIYRVRRIKDWKKIESLSIREWLEPLCGKNAYRIIWDPLIQSKFSVHAENISAVWMWKKLVLRGGTRDKKGKEQLVYFRGGFGRLAEVMVTAIENAGGEVSLNEKIIGVNAAGNQLQSVLTDRGKITGRQFLFTPALPIVADIFKTVADTAWLDQLKRIKYLGNICLVLRLSQSLSETYWLNINDPGFPFVGVIEHTNLDTSDSYRGTHMAFLSRYLAPEDPAWSWNDEQYAEFAIQHLMRMFPDFRRDWILEYKIWRAAYAQPVTERNYSTYVPGRQTPFENAHLSTMAHVYPEDRGTNYAIREGRSIANIIHSALDEIK